LLVVGFGKQRMGGEEHSLTALENNTKARFQGVGVGG